jgi:hypothetical protein
LAKPNYSYAKRQKDLARKKKQEEKRLRKASKKEARPEASTGQTPAEGEESPE